MYLGDALGGDICVERGVSLLRIMSHSQHNIDKILIKLHFSYVVKVLFLFFLIEVMNLLIFYFLYRLLKTYRGLPRTLGAMITP